MGTGSFVTPNKPFVSGVKSQSGPRSLRLNIDVPLLLIVVTLVVFGLLMVLSASVDASLALSGSPTYMFTRQIRWVLLGAIVAAGLTWFDYHWMKKFLLPMVGVTLVALLAVLIIRDERFNATRSLTGGSIQPSELAKVVTVIYLSFWLYSKRDQLGNLQFGLIPLGAILGIIGGLIILQPDLSATFTIVMLGGILFFLAGGEWRQIVMMLVLVAIFGYLIVTIFPTGSARLSSYLDGLRSPIEASYHVRRSLEAVVQGGWFGVGIGNSDTKFIGLPVPATDSIFAVIAEETGLVGAAFTICLYMLLLWRGLTIARRAADQLGSLLAAGLTLWLVAEALINMTVIVGLMPIAGNALPFISAGGSNMVMSLVAIGIIMSVARTSKKQENEEGRSTSAVVDLRRRDGRRSVPRVVRPASNEE
jgi:cell division protein FtsW